MVIDVFRSLTCFGDTRSRVLAKDGNARGGAGAGEVSCPWAAMLRYWYLYRLAECP